MTHPHFLPETDTPGAISIWDVADPCAMFHKASTLECQLIYKGAIGLRELSGEDVFAVIEEAGCRHADGERTELGHGQNKGNWDGDEQGFSHGARNLSVSTGRYDAQEVTFALGQIQASAARSAVR